MKRKTVFLGLISAASCGLLGLSLVLTTTNGIGLRVKSTDDFYSITINPGDVTTSETYTDGTFQVETDQLHNPINLKFEEAGVSGGVLYLSGNGAGKIFNFIGENSEIRGMNSITIKGENSPVTVSWGFQDGENIDYIDNSYDTAIPAGTEFDFNGKDPNYFCIESGSMSPSGITQIVIKYGVECQAGVNPNRTINGIRYVLRDGNHWAVQGFAAASFANVTLEASIDGMPVSEIWTYAFLNDKTIESINLDNITVVRTEAFSHCSNLANIGDYSNVVTFESYAFRDCDALTGTLSFTGEYVNFYQGAFTDSDGITALRFEDGSNVDMDSGSFRSMKEVASVYIGDSVAYSDDFLYDEKLATITVSEDNAKYKAIDNVLYEKDGDELTLYRLAAARPQTSYVMPSNVTDMRAYCCQWCSTLESVVINDSITLIPDDAFFGCEALTSVTFGANVETIGNYAFGVCDFTSITIPASVRTIYTRAFQECYKLTSVVFEEGCTKLCAAAFYDCPLLSSVILPASLNYVGVVGGFSAGPVFESCPSLAAVCTRLTSGDYANADADWLGDKTLLYYSASANNDGAHWHEVGSDNAPKMWSEKLYIQSDATFSADGTWYAVWAWTKGQDNGAFYYDSNAPVNYLYSISVPSDKNCYIVLRMKSGVDAASISSFPTGQFFNRTDDLENVLVNQITITQWDNGMGGGNLGISYSLKAAA